MTIEHDLALELIPVLFDVVVLDHDDHHVNLLEELVEVKNLVLHNLLVGEEGIEALERPSEMFFLNVNHLQGWTFADVIDVFFVCNPV